MSRSAVAGVALGVAVAAGCGGREAPAPAVAPAAVVPVASSSAVVAAPPPDDPNAGLVVLACARRDPCRLLKVHDAGTDERGRALSVALFVVGYPDEDAEDPEAGAPDAGPREPPVDAAMSFDPEGETFGWSYSNGCFAYEYWRFVREGAAMVEGNRIAEICNDGHGASGVGEDVVKVGPNRFELATSGGSSWRWSDETTYTLSPFARLSERHGGYWTLGGNQEDSHVDWQGFSGSTAWFSPACGPDGQPVGDEPPDEPEYGHLWIPQVPLEAAFVGEGWKTTRLDRCAARVDATADAGYLLSGSEGAAGDTTVRVVASVAGPLFVEVTDDVIGGGDLLEVWAAPVAWSYGDHCIEPAPKAGAVSWSVRVSDGKVTPGFGKPDAKSLGVERAQDAGGAVRFRLVLPQGQKAVTIAYADRDAGAKVERRIATSKLVDGRVATLGHLSPVGDRATCVVKDGALAPVVRPEKLVVP